MTAISYSTARDNLASTMEKVCADHSPVIITRDQDEAVVMLSLNDYESLEETSYLSSNPANARRLLDAIQALENGEGVVRTPDLDA